jgi:hypothetical protein
MAGEPQRTLKQRSDTTGSVLARVYAPDRAADEAIDILIEQLGKVPWARSDGGQPEAR